MCVCVHVCVCVCVCMSVCVCGCIYKGMYECVRIVCVRMHVCLCVCVQCVCVYECMIGRQIRLPAELLGSFVTVAPVETAAQTRHPIMTQTDDVNKTCCPSLQDLGTLA